MTVEPSSGTDDTALVAGLRSGDEAAFAELIDRYHGPLTRIARMYVATPALAEEIVAETWLAVIEGIGRFEGRSSFKTWLYRIALYRAMARSRKERRSRPLSSLGRDDADDADLDRFGEDGSWSVPPRPWTRPEERLAASELRDTVLAAIEQLPERQREVVTLRDVEGLRADEVAALVGVTEGNQRVLLHRGRTKVRAALAHYLEDP